MRRSTTFLAILAAASIALFATGPVSAKDKDRDVKVLTDTTVNITPSGTTATYAGMVTTRPKPKGKGKKEKKRRRKAADRCIDERLIRVWHGPVGEGFLIGQTRTDELGRWSLIGNKPPTGDTVTVEVRFDWKRRAADCDSGIEVKQAPPLSPPVITLP